MDMITLSILGGGIVVAGYLGFIVGRMAGRTNAECHIVDVICQIPYAEIQRLSAHEGYKLLLEKLQDELNKR